MFRWNPATMPWRPREAGAALVNRKLSEPAARKAPKSRAGDLVGTPQVRVDGKAKVTLSRTLFFGLRTWFVSNA